ncbi:hypothetical protein [Actinokineospora sp. HUAS TT18]|uniref:hypothetical protein n=1 Tax=Actinokineospora sp. HUAS TT18 TaxID=3447451 RepID=UPI003F5241E3
MAAKKSDPLEPTDELFAALREFIRSRGPAYLTDPNVSSIGIGYKVRGGKQTKEVSIQFTVAAKAEPEALAALGTVELPATITVNGVEVPTDVLERTYRPDFRVVAEAEANDRKVRVDPVRPGVSVGHPTITCGTIGAIVYDVETGKPCVLSNWHVLHGADGTLGDTVVQPGTHDDNRNDRNHLGPLVRSYLGIAGDGAIAAVDGRAVDPAILGLDVVPEELGEPELGDKVVKSGRTTGVTHGIVRRVDTIAKINYGATGAWWRSAASRSASTRPASPPTARSAAAATRARRGCSRPPTAGPPRSSRACTSRARAAATPTSTPWPACPGRSSRSSASP